MDSPPHFLAHRPGDSVAVAVRDLTPGPAQGALLVGEEPLSLQVHANVPLGHKVALIDIPSGGEVIEYGVLVAQATQDISVGDYVHVHNVRSARWQNSVA